MKTLEANVLDMMMAQVSKRIVADTTKDAVDELNALLDRKESIEALEKRNLELEKEVVQWRTKCEMYEAEKAAEEAEDATEEDDTALTDAMSGRAAAEARCEEKDKLIAVLQRRCDEMMSEMQKEPEQEPEKVEEPIEYDVDVVRGGDDRIRTLKVRSKK